MTHNVRQSQYDAVWRERDELARDLDKEIYHRIAIQRSEEALAAHCERLREALERLTRAAEDVDTGYMDGPVDIANDALDETPAQSLSAVKAEVLENEARLMLEAPQKSANGAFDMRVVAKIIRERANQIRSGE